MQRTAAVGQISDARLGGATPETSASDSEICRRPEGFVESEICRIGRTRHRRRLHGQISARRSRTRDLLSRAHAQPLRCIG